MANLPNQDELQRLIQTTVQEAVAAALAAHQPNPGPPGSSGPPGQPGQDGFDGRGGAKSSFRPRDVGYFDPNPDVDAIKVRDDKQIYHNVFSFTNRVRVKAISIDVLAENLESCLLGKADHWYTEELGHLSRLGLRNSVEEWCKALEARFRDSPSRALAMLESLRYTVNDVRRRKDPVDYIQNVVLHGKNAGIAADDRSQVLLAYEHMDGELRLHLPVPNDKLTIEGLIQAINAQKNIWFDIYTRPTTLNRPPQQYQQQQFGRNRSFQPYQPFNVRFGGDNQPRPQFPYVPYGNQPPNYQN